MPMPSLRELFRTGTGPSSSHTMAPRRAAEQFRARTPAAVSYRVTLMGSLAATGRGHLTDQALREALAPLPLEILWRPETILPFHPNAMDFEALDGEGLILSRWRCYSTGGGALAEGDAPASESRFCYELSVMRDILHWSESAGRPLWSYVWECEGGEIHAFLAEVWQVMQEEVSRGLASDGTLPGGLNLARKARLTYLKAKSLKDERQQTGLISAYALAAAEENAGGGVIVTAPTCGSCGVLPATLHYIWRRDACSEEELLRALAVAGLAGNIVKTNASISGAEVGCQGEIGTACAMAAAAGAFLMGGTSSQIEYAAEMGLEHHLGLTCDPVLGLVQIPCIERNALAATRALDCAEYALLSDGRHRISFDQVVETMNRTGQDLCGSYRETSTGGLARLYTHPE